MITFGLNFAHHPANALGHPQWYVKKHSGRNGVKSFATPVVFG
jgi:hypothetical protein